MLGHLPFVELETILPIGSASPGEFTFAPPKQDYAIRLTKYAAGEKMRPEAKATVDKSERIAPLTVEFSTAWQQKCHWDFGDTGSSIEKSPVHTFNTPGKKAGFRAK